VACSMRESQNAAHNINGPVFGCRGDTLGAVLMVLTLVDMSLAGNLMLSVPISWGCRSIDPFPAVPAEIKAVAMPLPTPQPHFGCRLH
jgi:hypothetical protein